MGGGEGGGRGVVLDCPFGEAMVGSWDGGVEGGGVVGVGWMSLARLELEGVW